MPDEVVESLEACAEMGVDFTDDFYQRFFELDQQAATLMSHCDQYMKGRMLQEVLELLIDRNDDYLRWEVNNHLSSYQVNFDMYSSMFTALQATVKSSLGDNWTHAYSEAWQSEISSTLRQIQAISIEASC